MSCHHVMSSCHVIMSCRDVMSSCHVIMSCHHVMSSCHVMQHLYYRTGAAKIEFSKPCLLGLPDEAFSTQFWYLFHSLHLLLLCQWYTAFIFYLFLTQILFQSQSKHLCRKLCVICNTMCVICNIMCVKCTHISRYYSSHNQHIYAENCV